MDLQTHWQAVFEKKRSDDVSWYQPHLAVSLGMIERAGIGPDCKLIDVGAGYRPCDTAPRLSLGSSAKTSSSSKAGARAIEPLRAKNKNSTTAGSGGDRCSYGAVTLTIFEATGFRLEYR